MNENQLIRRRIISYFSVAGGLLLVFILLRTSTWKGTTQLHTLMEVVATLLALFVGIVALVRFYTKQNNTFLFIGTGFLGTALLDGYHAIVTSTAFASSFPSVPSHLIPWSWVASRFFLSLMLFLSWWAWYKEKELGEARWFNNRTVQSIAGALTVASFMFFAFVPLPRAYYPELFFGRPEEFVPGLFFLLALIGYVRKGHWKTNPFEHWLVLSIIVGLVGQVVFMTFSYELFDGMFDMAHSLKKVSYVFVLIGLLISMYHLFRQAEKNEKALQDHATALERSNKELEQFAYVASHDLQEPLRKVINFSELLAERYEGQLDADADKFIAYIVDGAVRMRGLITDLLTYSRVGTREITFELTDCEAALDEALGNLEVALEETGAAVTRDPLPRVMADNVQLVQVFQNLIGNALKYRSEDSPKVHIGAVRTNGVCRFSVRDNGIGIDPEYAERVFVIFQRLHGRLEYSGTGIGLAVCKKIVERHGGRIWVESQEGAGATFHFTVPTEQGN